jgi:hypothetical protein
MLPMLVTSRYNFRVIITKYISSTFRNTLEGSERVTGMRIEQPCAVSAEKC